MRLQAAVRQFLNQLAPYLAKLEHKTENDTPRLYEEHVGNFLQIYLDVVPSNPQNWFGMSIQLPVGENVLPINTLAPREMDLSTGNIISPFSRSPSSPFHLIMNRPNRSTTQDQPLCISRDDSGFLFFTHPVTLATRNLRIASVSTKGFAVFLPGILEWNCNGEDNVKSFTPGGRLHQWLSVQPKSELLELETLVSSFLKDQGEFPKERFTYLETTFWQLSRFLGYVPLLKEGVSKEGFTLSFLYHLSILPWQSLYYFPIRGIKHGAEISSGDGAIYSSDRKLTEGEVWPIYSTLQALLYPTLVEHQGHRLAARNNELTKQYERTVQISIMARNLSHNIGSHVLSEPVLVPPDFHSLDVRQQHAHLKQLRNFHSFLQQRMDFIAQVVSYEPSWGEPFLFFQDLLQGFFSQFLLLDTLVKDQGVPEIQFVVHTGSGESENVFRYHRQVEISDNTTKQSRIFTWRRYVEPNELETPEPQIIVVVPGGLIGGHAFYDILENLLRNSAKYGDRTGPGGKRTRFEFHIRIQADPSGDQLVYMVSLWDNFSTQSRYLENGKCSLEIDEKQLLKDKCRCRICTVRRGYEEPLSILDGGRPVVIGARGLNEIKLCSRSLSGVAQVNTLSARSEEIIGPSQRYDIAIGKEVPDIATSMWISALTAPDEQGGSNIFLGTHIRMYKPCPLCLVSRQGDYEEYVVSEIGLPTYSELDLRVRSANGILGKEWNDALKVSPQVLIVQTPVSDDACKELVEWLVRNHRLLPYRILLATPTESSHEILRQLLTDANMVARRVHFCSMKEVEHVLSESLDSPLTLTIRVMTLWLSKYKSPGDNPWKLIISFDRNKGHATFLRWQEILSNIATDPDVERITQLFHPVIVRLLKEPVRSANFDHLSREEKAAEIAIGRASIATPIAVETAFPPIYPEGDEPLEPMEQFAITAEWLKHVQQSPERIVLLDNHGKSTILPDDGKMRLNCACYHEFSSKNMRLYHLLESPPPGKAGILMLLQLLEATLTRIIVVDERVASACLRDSEENAEAPALIISDQGKELFRSKIFIPCSLHLAPQQRIALVPSPRLPDTQPLVKEGGHNLLIEEEGLFLDSPVESSLQCFYENPVNNSLDTCATSEADVLIIHLSIIEQQKTRNHWKKLTENESSHFERLYRLAPVVIGTSGRGRNMTGLEEYLPGNLPFLEFSIVQANTYSEISKYHLVRAAFAVHGPHE